MVTACEPTFLRLTSSFRVSFPSGFGRRLVMRTRPPLATTAPPSQSLSRTTTGKWSLTLVGSWLWSISTDCILAASSRESRTWSIEVNSPGGSALPFRFLSQNAVKRCAFGTREAAFVRSSAGSLGSSSR